MVALQPKFCISKRILDNPLFDKVSIFKIEYDVQIELEFQRFPQGIFRESQEKSRGKTNGVSSLWLSILHQQDLRLIRRVVEVKQMKIISLMSRYIWQNLQKSKKWEELHSFLKNDDKSCLESCLNRKMRKIRASTLFTRNWPH